MLFTNCFFDEDVDISPVIPCLSVDLDECLLNGIVPGDASVPQFNGLEETSSILGRVRDPFDAIEHQRALSSAMSSYRPPVSSPPQASSTPSGAE